jgi:hypothetical protein
MGRKYRDAERNNTGRDDPLESHLRKRVQPGELFMECHKNEQHASYLGFAKTPGKGSECRHAEGRIAQPRFPHAVSSIETSALLEIGAQTKTIPH